MHWFSGLISGAIAAVIVSLVSFPLDSPDDSVFNTGTVTIGAMVLGLSLGALWTYLRQRPNRVVTYGGVTIAAFAVVIVAAAANELVLDGSISFVVPLAVIAFAVTALLPPILTAVDLPGRAQLGATVAAPVVALALGIGLSGIGDAESGRLELPNVDDQTPSAEQTITLDDVAGKVFVVVAGESGFTYTVHEKRAVLPQSNDAVGRTSELSGEVRLDGLSTISADMSTLTSDQDRRDNYVRTTIFQSDPIATFAVDDLAGLPDEYVSGTTVTQTVAGTATVRGVERPLTFEVEARLTGDEIQIVGRTDFTWADFEISPPDIPGIVDVEDNVHIEVLVVARATS